MRQINQTKLILLTWLIVLITTVCLVYSCNEDTKRHEREYFIKIYKNNKA